MSQSGASAPERGSPLGYALVVAAAAAWGTWPLVLRRAHAAGEIAQELVSFVVVATQVFASAPLLLRGLSKERAKPHDVLALGWLGVSSAANTALFFLAYARTTVAIAVLSHCLAPLFVALVSPLLLREAPRPRTVGAVLVALAGLVLVLGPFRAGASPRGVEGALLGAASAVFYASNVVVSKRLARVFSATELVVFHGVVAVPLLALLVPHRAWAAASGHAVAIVVAGGLGPGAVASLAFNAGLRRVPASHAAMLTLLEPACAVVLSAVVLGESLGVMEIMGIFVVLGASAIVLAEGRGARDRLELARVEPNPAAVDVDAHVHEDEPRDAPLSSRGGAPAARTRDLP